MNDLISREVLRNVILNDRKLDGANANWEVNRILAHIDNAPTIRNEYMRGYEAAEREYKRPQGEWIANPRGDYVCNKCSWVIGKFERNFCCNCGAKMKGGAE